MAAAERLNGIGGCVLEEIDVCDTAASPTHGLI